ncbi:asparagine synthase-related protein [Pseudonocardia sp. NPDC049635]|uniref:asparagine synthase-related protein n=1 Tax=Pseudonocardia sp. NPDC049635 TaxID=3155506 RepID=UPI0033FBF194
MSEAFCTEIGPWLRTAARPTIDREALALLFAPPVLYGEFYPWQGASLAEPPARCSTGPGAGLGPAFGRAVARAAADAAVIGVSFSGGMDSLAVLAEACRQARGRRVVAFTIALVDDHGRAAADVAAALITQLGLRCEVQVVDTTETAAVAWSPIGPRLDALPQLNAALAARAAATGCEVLLSGDGADEVLEVPRFATCELLTARGPRAALRYLGDRGRGSVLVDEAAAVLARAVPQRAGARMYWGATWATTLGAPVPAVVADRFRARVQDWSTRWLAGHLDRCREHRSWAARFAHDAIWPHAPLLDAGAIPERSPFLDAEVLTAAAALTPAHRYDPDLPTPYQRNKAAVVSLIEPDHRPMLPPAKQYFQTALGALIEPCQPRLLTAAGVIDPAGLDTADTAVAMTVTATETWLRDALARGARLPGVTS